MTFNYFFVPYRAGDFVIEINGYNTQLASMNEVRQYCSSQTDYLKLRLRRTEYRDYSVSASTDAFTNWKLDLGIVFKNIQHDGHGDRLGICEGDELIKV